MRSLVQVQDGPFEIGGLAQLVERLLCKQDVSGSSPLTSMPTLTAIRKGSASPEPREGNQFPIKARSKPDQGWIKAGSTGEPRGDEDRLGRRGLERIPAFRISAVVALVLNAGFTA